MILKTIFNGFLVFHLTKLTKSQYLYEFILQDEDLAQPCYNTNTSVPDIYFDTSNLKVKRFESGEINLCCSIEIVNGFPENSSIQLSIEFYKKYRGSWMNTVYNFHRSDFCQALFDPTELWHKYLNTIPKEQRKCPLYNGQKFSINVTLDNIFSLPNPRLAGDYMGHYVLSSNNFEKSICVNVFTEAYRN